MDDNNNHGVIDEMSEIFNIKASFDAGWQKRGTGRSYNSLSGHATLIGYHSGKILSYAVRCTQCRLCNLGHNKSDHDCRSNYKGSAKGMEPDMAIELVNNNVLLKQENVAVSVLIGDDDSSTIAAVRRTSNNQIEKWSDLNHTKKSLTTAMYTMKLPTKIIAYFSNCFSIAVKQNRGNATQVKSTLLSIVPHAFGDHTLCGDWCEAKGSEDSYVYKYLPNGEPLRDVDQRTSLTIIFSRFANNANKIANCGSTQRNESANSVIASKSPKSKHYSGSESLSYRVAASVSQINKGCQFVSDVFQKLKVSVGGMTTKFRGKKDFYRKKRYSSNNIQKKRRRLQLKKNRSSKTTVASQKEGLTYETGCSFDDVSASLPNPIPELNDASQSKEFINNSKIIIFDLETTGLSKTDEICQIAACTEDTSFNVYIVPSRPISRGAFNVTGLQVVNDDLYLHDEKVDAFSARVAFNKLLDYLRSFRSPIVLLAHNGFRFDTPRILKLASDVGAMPEFQFVVKGFADSLLISKSLLKERCKEKKKFSVQALASDFLPQESTAALHNAVHDTKILRMLLHKMGITEEIVKSNAKLTEVILQEQISKAQEILTKNTLQEYNNKISKSIIDKMAKAGITKTILIETYQTSGINGIRILFSGNVGGKARISSNTKVLNKIYALFENNVSV